ncbi:MAG: putative metal-binding motif-containing protein [Deltaproteobacteria bacterium]|nr:putative metal-binding motif-containing protein [Deltaproteobacteria bacterium]
MTTARRILAVVALGGLCACGAPPALADSGSCPSGTVACVEGCCGVCLRHEDCGPGFGCCDTGQCSRECNPCSRMVCDKPPAPTCADANTLRTYTTGGSCSDGACAYPYSDGSCAFGCSGGACLPEGSAPAPTGPCAGVVCNQPPAAKCQNANTLRSYASLGSCALGSCDYGSIDTPCPGGCANGICDGCVDPTCQTLGFECGSHPNPCGGTLSCGTCAGGVACGGNGKCLCPDADQDGFKDAACGGNDCADADPALHPYQAEACDGLDNDCDGSIDEGTFLPARFSSISWVPPGFAGLSGGVLLTWDKMGAFYDAPAGKITMVFSLAALWEHFSKTGTRPPTSGIDSLVILPPGQTLGMAFAGDSIAVTVGGVLYLYDSGAQTWVSEPVTDFFPTPEVDTMTLLRVQDFPGLALPEDVLYARFGSEFRYYVPSSGWSATPLTVAQVVCPPGSTSCPTSVDVIGALALGSGCVLVNHGDQSQIASMVWNSAHTSLVFTWESIDLTAYSCALSPSP